MPVEVTMLRRAAVSLAQCPNCQARPFEPFLRGTVQRPRRAWLIGKPRACYCALICSACKEIVGYEDPVQRVSIAGVPWYPSYELRPKYRPLTLTPGPPL